MSDGGKSFIAPRFAIWVNGLWFSSLICTLSASSIAVMVKQWLHQYSQGLSGIAQEAALLRQYRHESMLKWQVAEIIAALPMLLQVALSLFLSGLLILLWNLHQSVAIAATVLVSALLSFTILTSFLPAFYEDCCYQSPQSLSVFILSQAIAKFSSKMAQKVEKSARNAAIETVSLSSIHYSALAYTQNVAQAFLAWLGPSAGRFRNWRARERPSARAHQAELEQSLALTAYHVMADEATLNTTLVPCLSGMDALSTAMSARYGGLVRDVTERLPNDEWQTWRPVMRFVLIVLSLLTHEPRRGMVRRVLRAMPRFPPMTVRSTLGMLYLHTLSQLVKRRIAPRDAFRHLMVYLDYTQIATDKRLQFSQDVLEKGD